MPTTVTAQLVSHFCRDHMALARFYADAFGFEEIPEVGSPIFVALDAGGVALGFHADEALDLLGIADRRDGTSANHVTFDLGATAEVDASVERITALGATVIQGPFDTYYAARQVVYADPEGNVFRVTDSQIALPSGS
jgi:predicted enzyme related to lactoylglutathione lyase